MNSEPSRRGEEEPENAGGGAPALRRHKRILRLAALAATAVTVASLLATGWIRSPQQRMAETQPPEMTVLTAAVEQRVLKETVVLRGQIGAGGTVDVSPAPGGEGRAVVTGIRKRQGQEFGAGSVLIEVAGRPVVALRGSLPAYRDLRPGSEGKDVAQLQHALRAMGHPSSDRSGSFGRSTKEALSAFYEDLGYEVATTGEDDAKAIAAAKTAVRNGERTLAESVEALDGLKADARSGHNTEADKFREAERAVRYAREDLAQMKLDLAVLESQAGPMLPMSEVVFLPSLPGRVEKLNGSVGQEVKPPLLTLSSGALVVHANVNPAQRSLLDTGMPVSVTSELTGQSYVGTVSSIGDLQQDETGARSHGLTVKTKERLPATLAGADVRLTVEAASTDGEVLVVPVSALYASVDGQTAVLLRLPDGRSERVVVAVGVSGGGYTAVEAADGKLKSGDQVVLGERAK